MSDDQRAAATEFHSALSGAAARGPWRPGGGRSMMLQGHGEGAVRGIAGRISFVDTAVSTDLYKKSYPQRNSRTISYRACD